MTMRVPAVLLTVLLASPSTMVAATLRVPSEYPTIQAAVNAASLGDTVLVAPGTYLENVVINRRVALLSEAGPEVTTIDGQRLGPVVLVNPQVDHVSIEGFRITRGDDQGRFHAGGIAIEYGDPGGSATIRRNIVEYNRALGGAAGIWVTRDLAIIEDNLVQHNSCINCYAGGMVARGTIERNIVRNTGGGMTAVSTAFSTVAWNTIVDNSATRALWAYGGGSLHHNTIARNAGGVSVSIEGEELIEFRNNLVVHGAADGLYCGTGARIQCNNVWGSPGSSYNGACAGMLGVDGNISADPLFCDEANGDYRLNAASPCAPLNSPPGCGLIGALDVACGIVGVGGTTPPFGGLRLAITPNPVWMEAWLTADGLQKGSVVEFVNAFGRVVDTVDPTAPGPIRWYPSPDLPSGVYFARIRGGWPGVIATRFVLIR